MPTRFRTSKRSAVIAFGAERAKLGPRTRKDDLVWAFKNTMARPFESRFLVELEAQAARK